VRWHGANRRRRRTVRSEASHVRLILMNVMRKRLVQQVPGKVVQSVSAQVAHHASVGVAHHGGAYRSPRTAAPGALSSKKREWKLETIEISPQYARGPLFRQPLPETLTFHALTAKSFVTHDLTGV
jgi:hypothetical protein